jgi:hypothetical protein
MAGMLVPGQERVVEEDRFAGNRLQASGAALGRRGERQAGVQEGSAPSLKAVFSAPTASQQAALKLSKNKNLDESNLLQQAALPSGLMLLKATYAPSTSTDHSSGIAGPPESITSRAAPKQEAQE